MRILFFTENLGAGGKERRMLELINQLKFKYNHDILIVLTENKIQYKYVYEWDIKIEIVERSYFKKDTSIFFKFYRLCKKFKPDVIHTWGIMHTFYAIPSKLFGKSYLVSSMITNASLNIRKSIWSSLIFDLGFKCSDVNLSNSYAGIKAYKLNKAKVKVIYNGVRLERFDRNFDLNYVEKKFNIIEDIKVVMVASTSKNKFYDLFTELAKNFLLSNRKIAFIAVGGGDDFERLSKRVKNENISNLFFLNHQSNVEEIVYSCDIGMLLSPSEGFPNSVMEMMALGKVVIASNVGGVPELINDGKDGFLVNNNLEDIINIFTEIINKPKLKKIIGEEAKTKIFNEFSSEIMTMKFNQLYKNL